MHTHTTFLFILVVTLFILLTGCEGTTNPNKEEIPSGIINPSTNGFIDSRDDQFYPTTTIGTQEWMAKNLNYFTDSLSYCLDTNAINCEIFGRYYSWELLFSEKLCPDDWHLPDIYDWTALLHSVAEENAISGREDLGGYTGWQEITYYPLSQHLMATAGWSTPDGLDTYGFWALPHGTMSYKPYIYSGRDNTRSSASFWGFTISSGSFDTGDTIPVHFIVNKSTSYTDTYANDDYAIPIRCVRYTPQP